MSSIGRGSEIEEEYNKKFLSTVGLLPTQHEEPEDIYRHIVQQSNGNRKIIRKLTALAKREMKKSVRDELDVEAEGEFPEHCVTRSMKRMALSDLTLKPKKELNIARRKIKLMWAITSRKARMSVQECSKMP